LKEAYGLLKSGGEMVYSVCSFCPLEGEMNVKWFLETYNDMELMTPDEKFYKFASHGVEKILGDLAKKVLRFDPVVNQESIGFFIAKFRKASK
jgi:16S rRNA C967 or C1407 C5-methylase (RsmB/RsmF family)